MIFLIMPWPLSVYRFFNQTQHENIMDVIRTNRPEIYRIMTKHVLVLCRKKMVD